LVDSDLMIYPSANRLVLFCMQSM